MATLVKQTILEYIKKGELVIDPYIHENGEYDIEPSSYDLRIGTIVWKELNPKTNNFHTKVKHYDSKRSIDKQDTLSLQPGQVIFVITKEEIKMPKNMCGTVYAKNSFSRDGILSFTTGHVDPGVQCPIVIRLINLRAIPFQIQLGQPVYTIVFNTLEIKDVDNLESHRRITREQTLKNTMDSANSALGNALNDISLTNTLVKKDEFNKLFRSAIGKYAWVILVALALLVTLTANFIKIWEHFFQPNNFGAVANSLINTEEFSIHLRRKGIDLNEKKILITNFSSSEQEKDLSEPANCNGFGRVRHFKLDSGTDWMPNPLPIFPAAKALGVSPNSQIRAQVFQNSVCNWRCWYCFVDFKLLSGDSKYSSFLTCDEMVDMYMKEENPAPMIDLTGGQPDLTPEWVPWMMQTMKERGLDKKIYLWSDDNLSNDYLWKYLSNDQIDLLSSYKMYSRVCCFKGIDERSFSLNTKADPKLFANQFELCRRLLGINLDLYCYITLTANSDTNFGMTVPKFIDSIQIIDEMLPLRIVPLKILEFTPVISRMNDGFADMMKGQYKAMEIWQKELTKRFPTEQLNLPITEIKLKKY